MLTGIHVGIRSEGIVTDSSVNIELRISGRLLGSVHGDVCESGGIGDHVDGCVVTVDSCG